MGRSQVLRNRTKGRPGQAGRGRGRGGGEGGRGGGGRGGAPSQRRKGPDPRTLGSNAFRYERGGGGGTEKSSGGYSDPFDGLLDDVNLSDQYYGGLDALGEGEEGDLLADATLSSAAAAALALGSSGGDGGGDGSFDGGGRAQPTRSPLEWTADDIKALDARLRQVPIHERLGLPRHIGKHLEETYGIDGRGEGRKKTLAELREERGRVVPADDGGEDDAPLSPMERGARLHSYGAEKKGGSPDFEEGGEDEKEEEDEEDLDAWLDDMIA